MTSFSLAGPAVSSSDKLSSIVPAASPNDSGRKSSVRTDAANATARFDHVLGREQARRDAAKADDADALAAKQAKDASASQAQGSAVSHRRRATQADASDAASQSSDAPEPANTSNTADASRDADNSTQAVSKDSNGSNDPSAVLGWLQAQVGASPVSPDAVAATPANDASFAQVGISKADSLPGNTPPTQAPGAPLPASLRAGASVLQSDDDAEAGDTPVFTLAAGSASESTSGPAALTPSLSAALAAVVSSNPQAAPALVARGVEQFQALLGRTDIAAPATAAQPVVATAVTSVSAQLAAPLATDSPDLPVRLGERVQWLVDNGLQEARLQLHPRELGTVNVHVRIEARGASVWFAAEHPAARAALESALPQLRERFAGDGVALNQAQVAAQTTGWNLGGSSQQSSSSSSGRDAWRGTSGSGADGVADAEADPGSASSTRVIHVGLVDRYA